MSEPVHRVDVFHQGPWRISWRLGAEFDVTHLQSADAVVTQFTTVDEPVDSVDAGHMAFKWWRNGGEQTARDIRHATTLIGSSE